MALFRRPIVYAFLVSGLCFSVGSCSGKSGSNDQPQDPLVPAASTGQLNLRIEGNMQQATGLSLSAAESVQSLVCETFADSPQQCLIEIADGSFSQECEGFAGKAFSCFAGSAAKSMLNDLRFGAVPGLFTSATSSLIAGQGLLKVAITSNAAMAKTEATIDMASSSALSDSSALLEQTTPTTLPDDSNISGSFVTSFPANTQTSTITASSEWFLQPFETPEGLKKVAVWHDDESRQSCSASFTNPLEPQFQIVLSDASVATLDFSDTSHYIASIDQLLERIATVDPNLFNALVAYGRHYGTGNSASCDDTSACSTTRQAGAEFACQYYYKPPNMDYWQYDLLSQYNLFVDAEDVLLLKTGCHSSSDVAKPGYEEICDPIYGVGYHSEWRWLYTDSTTGEKFRAEMACRASNGAKCPFTIGAPTLAENIGLGGCVTHESSSTVIDGLFLRNREIGEIHSLVTRVLNSIDQYKSAELLDYVTDYSGITYSSGDSYDHGEALRRHLARLMVSTCLPAVVQYMDPWIPGSNREIIDCGTTYYGCYRDGKFDAPVTGLAGILDLVPTYDGVFEMRSEHEWEHNKWSESGDVLSCQVRDVLSILVRQSSPSLIRYDGYLTLTARSQCTDEDGVLVPSETSPFANRETRPTKVSFEKN